MSALFGTLVGGAITFFVTRWQLTKTITAESTLASEQRLADTRLAQVEREGIAARQLLERLADLYAWLPALSDLMSSRPPSSRQARSQCSSAIMSLRRGMHTELVSLSNSEVRDRYRTLVRLTYDVGRRGIGCPYRRRQISDVRTYLRYVQATLVSVIDASPLPEAVEAPVLDRPEGEAWSGPDLGPYWSDPADGS